MTGLKWRPVLDLRHPDFKRYFVLSLPIMLGFSIIVVDDWILTRLGSLVEEGVVSQINYAKTLMKVPMGVFGLAAEIVRLVVAAAVQAVGGTGPTGVLAHVVDVKADQVLDEGVIPLAYRRQVEGRDQGRSALRRRLACGVGMP